MPSFCAVLDCADKYGRDIQGNNVSFHKFPFKNKELLEKWTVFTLREINWLPTKWNAVCSRHFAPEDYKCLGKMRKILKKTAVPSIRWGNISQEKFSTEGEKNAADLRDSIIGGKQKAGIRMIRGKRVYEEPVRNDKSGDESESDESSSVEDSSQDSSETSYTVADENKIEVQQNAIIKNVISRNSPEMKKFHCRLCGQFTTSVITFSSNFETYGMIQKCFPTLNIRLEDNLPKEICRVCLKRVESFAAFIDNVLETQNQLQNKFRAEKPSSKLNERHLKFKQEPAAATVRVKTEAKDNDYGDQEDDVDGIADESLLLESNDKCSPTGDSPPQSQQVDRKIQFCDFPMLNAQDIINNCDIMEIINLDDPFIDLDDCQNERINNKQNQNGNDNEIEDAAQEMNCTKSIKNKKILPSAHELLTTHLLIEEHSYANATSDLKEECHSRQFYKTEKIEADICDQDANALFALLNENEILVNNDVVANNNQQLDLIPDYVHEELVVETASGVKKPALHKKDDESQKRLDKPVVTSVDKIDNQASKQHMLATAKKATENATRTKPNIVVLNESIVKSSPAFQLQECLHCNLKFFSTDTLQQHLITTHQIQSSQKESVKPQNVDLHPQNGMLETLHRSGENCESHPHPTQTQITGNNGNYMTTNSSDQQHHQANHASRMGPMVSVPTSNLNSTTTTINTQDSSNIHHPIFSGTCKFETDLSEPETNIRTGNPCFTSSAPLSVGGRAQQQSQQQPQQQGFASSNLETSFTKIHRNENNSNKIQPKNKVKILDMQQTFPVQYQNPALQSQSACGGNVQTNTDQNITQGIASAEKNQTTYNSRSLPIINAQGPQGNNSNFIQQQAGALGTHNQHHHHYSGQMPQSDYVELESHNFHQGPECGHHSGHHSANGNATLLTDHQFTEPINYGTPQSVNGSLQQQKLHDSHTNNADNLGENPINCVMPRESAANSQCEMYSDFSRNGNLSYGYCQINGDLLTSQSAVTEEQSALHPFQTYVAHEQQIMQQQQQVNPDNQYENFDLCSDLPNSNTDYLRPNGNAGSNLNANVNVGAIKKSVRYKPIKARKCQNRSLQNSTSRNGHTSTPYRNSFYFEQMAADYLRLCKRYRALQIKCWQLECDSKHQSEACTQHPAQNASNRHVCNMCKQSFDTIYELLRHKQSTDKHFVKSPKSKFSNFHQTLCIGCQKYFCTKLALRNHMQYICQLIPLRCLRQTQIRSYKCRYCLKISFMHWRLYRHHEVKCSMQHRDKKSTNAMLNKQMQGLVQQQQYPSKSAIETNVVMGNAASFSVDVCDDDLHLHKCDLCSRTFDQRKDLIKHKHGFHLQIKPYQCLECKQRFTSRTDMLSCKHSIEANLHQLEIVRESENSVT